MDSLLSILIWLPILGGGSVLLIGNNRGLLAKWASVVSVSYTHLTLPTKA